MAKPRVIVFDLDYTMWPFWIDRKINIEPPFSRTPDGKVFDACQREVKCFPDTEHILQRLHAAGYKLGVASEAFCRDDVLRLVKMFNWDQYFHYKEVYPGSKITHLVRIKKMSGVHFYEMLFFDDNKEILEEVANTCLGLTCIHADAGLSEDILEQGLFEFSANQRNENLRYNSRRHSCF